MAGYISCQEEDTVGHIIIKQYAFFRQVWLRCFKILQIRSGILNLQDKQEDWWTTAHSAMPKQARKGFDSIVMPISWTL
jgi:hypothetical protein